MTSTEIMSDFMLAMSMFTQNIRAPLESMFYYSFWIMNNIQERELFLNYYNTRMNHVKKMNSLRASLHTVAEHRVCAASIILDIVSVSHDVVEYAETFLSNLFIRSADINDWAENTEKMLDRFLSIVRKETPRSPLLGPLIDPRTLPHFSFVSASIAFTVSRPAAQPVPFLPDPIFTPPAFSTTDVSFQYDRVDVEQCVLILLVPSFPGLFSYVVNGSSIACAEKRFNVQILTGAAASIRHVNCGPAFKPIIIKGRLADTVRAQQYMSARLDNKLRLEKMPRGTLRLFVPTVATKFFIGKHGSNVNRMMQESGTRIQFEVESEPAHLGLGGRIVSIRGTLNGCSKAHYMMARQMTDERLIEPQWDHKTYINENEFPALKL